MSDDGPRTILGELPGIVRRILTTASGGPVILGDGVVLEQRGDTGVYRFPIAHGAPELPASVVVKHGGHDRLRNEWAGLAFLTEIAPDGALAPRYLGGDVASGVVVMEEIAGGTSVDRLLLGSDPVAAESALVALSRTVGRQHAATIGQEGHDAAVRDQLGFTTPRAWADVDLAAEVTSLTGALELPPPPPGVMADIAHLQAVEADPGPFSVYVHRDPCPDNCFRMDATSRVRIIDFELGGFGHALLDGVYGRMHFPSCWCVGRLPDGLPDRMEAAYRAELAVGCAAARDDRLFARAVAEAAALWFIVGFRMTPLDRMLANDGDWGTATVRQRMLLRGPIVTRTLADANHLAALGAFLGSVTDALRARWQESTPPMPLYPAFRDDAPKDQAAGRALA